MDSVQLSGLIGYFFGLVLGNVVLGALVAGIGRLIKKDWNYWRAGVWMGVLGCLGQAMQLSPIGVLGTLLGLAALWYQSDKWEKENRLSV